jgi:hypothetical protein
MQHAMQTVAHTVPAEWKHPDSMSLVEIDAELKAIARRFNRLRALEKKIDEQGMEYTDRALALQEAKEDMQLAELLREDWEPGIALA